MHDLKIILLLGSIRLGRQSHKVAHILERRLNAYAGVDAEIADLQECRLPMMEERYGIHPDPPEVVKELGEKIRQADAIILISPEYGGSYSGVLKNAVDYFGRQLAGKPIGVATTSAGQLGGINASHQLQHLILGLGAYPMPKKLLVPAVHENPGNGYAVEDGPLTDNARQFVEEFLPFARAISAKRQGQFRTPSREELSAAR